MTRSEKKIRLFYVPINEEYKQPDCVLSVFLQVAAHPGGDQGLPALQQTAVERGNLLGWRG